MSGPDLVERLRDHYRTDIGMSAETADDIANAAAELSTLRSRCELAEAALEQAAERYTVFRQLLIDTMDTSPPTEGAQEFINRLTDAMEAAADKLELPNSNGGGS